MKTQNTIHVKYRHGTYRELCFVMCILLSAGFFFCQYIEYLE